MPITLDGTTGITAPAIDVATPIVTTEGGTGLSSFTSGGAMYATSTTALTTGTLPVASGGTGATALTANNVLLGNGTAALQLVAPGSSGNVLTSNGTTWTSAAAGGGSLQAQLFTSPGTWTKPSTVSQVRVTVVGGGGGANLAPNPAGVGGTGGTSSFGSAVSATGGGGTSGNNGTSTISTGTALKSAFSFTFTTGARNVSFGSIAGFTTITAASSPVAYSTSSPQVAGACGISTQYVNGPTGSGGIGQAIVPVSAPVAVTVGAGGTRNPNVSNGNGGDGAVLVEFVG